MNIPALFIFDMDGTMFDTEPISYKAWQAVCLPRGYDIPESLFRSVIGMDNRRIIQMFSEFFGKDFPYQEIWQEKTAYQLQYYHTHPVPCKPGLIQCLEFAKTHQIQCAVASSSPRSQIEYLLEKTRIAPYFQIVQSGEEVAHGKPEPDIFLLVCQKANGLPAQALVLEDSQNGILAADAAHIPAIWIPDLVQIAPEVQQKAWRTCQSLAEVPLLFQTREWNDR